MAKCVSVFTLLCLKLSLANGLVSGICYDGIGCFEAYNDCIFSDFAVCDELPDSPDEVQVRTFLWTRQNPTEAQEIMYKNITSIEYSKFDSTRPTKVLIHGFMSSKEASPAVANLSMAFLKAGDYNVIGVDWSKGANIKYYPKPAANTRIVGAVVARLLQKLQEKFQMKTDDLHVIGHSLGAHAAGDVGMRMPGIARITGLDPAGPLFMKKDPKDRLDSTDALFVDVIHSNGGWIKYGEFGILEPLGHMDFFPNGGQSQPGCGASKWIELKDVLTGKFGELFNSVSCAHDRAIWYFIESVLNNNCQFTSYPCSSWDSFKAGNCTSCGNAGCPTMGINSVMNPVKGAFYLQTNAQTPFCKTRPIVAKFHYPKEREQVRSASFDKGDALKTNGLGIGTQIPKGIRDARKPLYPAMKEARDANKSVRFVGEKLFIDGKEHQQPKNK